MRLKALGSGNQTNHAHRHTFSKRSVRGLPLPSASTPPTLTTEIYFENTVRSSTRHARYQCQCQSVISHHIAKMRVAGASAYALCARTPVSPQASKLHPLSLGRSWGVVRISISYIWSTGSLCIKVCLLLLRRHIPADSGSHLYWSLCPVRSVRSIKSGSK
jgi:hypothetical protein